MKLTKTTNRCLKAFAGVQALAVIVALGLSGNCLAAEYQSISMYPQHVGMFTTVSEQQFLAFGNIDTVNTGNQINITTEVDWISSDESIVTIDENGVARLVAGKTAGQVKITCSYPKQGGSKTIGSATNLLLLK